MMIYRNYLLNSFYKIYMVMIRARMQDATEQVLSRTQYGFRPHRSTSNAIYNLRRIQDYSEIKGAHLSIALLDWEKRLIKFNMTSLFLLCADWASAVAILRSLRIVILSLCFSSKIILVHPVLSNRPPGFVKDVHYPHVFFVLVMTCIVISSSAFHRMLLTTESPGWTLTWSFTQMTQCFSQEATEG